MAWEGKQLISLDDLSDAQLDRIVEWGTGYAGDDRPEQVLDGAVVGIYFTKTSTRTRTAFSAGALRLGARIVTYGPGDLQTNTGETLGDTGAVLAGMLDALVARTAGPPGELRELASGGLAVVNAMTADEHPTQALADLVTLAQHFGHVAGLRVLYAGEGNNTAAALALALSRYPGVELHLRTPRGYGLAPDVLARAHRYAQRCGASVSERHDMAALPTGVDAIYTTRWQTTGTSKADPGWRAVFAPFRVHAGLWDGSPKAVFLHDLPAHRGEEVDADVLDGPASIAFTQAENKMHSAMAALRHCLAESAS
ncbi:MAG TPA: ornithine carbamoyltransferase [Rugosimonospora sp.]|nr:ornithine carbamoyltransferase [Rugosimonospora sp.]